MSLELIWHGMGLDFSVNFGEFSPMGSMTSSKERKKKKERKKERKKEKEFLGIQ